jgi:hypothetical protein
LSALPVVANHGNPDTIWDLAEKKMVGKSLEINTPPVFVVEMKSLWFSGREIDKRIQLLPKFISQTVIDSVVMAQNSGNILLYVGMKKDVHFRRSF